MDELLKSLNDSQRAAVEYCDGASLVVAGAGSGKTRVLTYKIAWLLKAHGLQPWHILALTFTNKAAREMRQRIAGLVGEEEARRLRMGTFHSVFARILRVEALTLGYTSQFTIYDQNDARSLVKSICREMELDDKKYKPNDIADVISQCKNHLVLAEDFEHCSLFDSSRPHEAEVFRRYQARCKSANAMDFDDLLVNTWLLFSQHEDIRRKYVELFHFVLVDEYQDTNHAQQQIIYLLTKERQCICVVGDDAQSIYSFRGANIENMLNFQSLYNDTRIFKLEQNYRSTQYIVQAADSLIKKNQQQIPKDVYSENAHGERPILKYATSDKEEASIVCSDIERIRSKEQCSYGDFAILYRTNSQSRAFEEQLRKNGIPYTIYGGLSFYQRKEIKDIIAYYRVVVNPNDEEALRRIINYPARGIGDTTVRKIADSALANGISPWQVIESPQLLTQVVSKAAAGKLQAFASLIRLWQSRLHAEDAYTLGRAIIEESGIARELMGSSNPEDISRRENLDAFISGLRDFVTAEAEDERQPHIGLGDFLQEVALLTDLDSDDDATQQKVSLMTIHSAKGLEFSTVFIVGLEENIFPSPMSATSLKGLEEERRLLYVAITRAEHHCIITCAENRFRYGRMEHDEPSRFIKDIDPSLLTIGRPRKAFSADDDAFGASRLPWARKPYGSSANTGYGAGRGSSYGSSANTGYGAGRGSSYGSPMPGPNFRRVQSVPSGEGSRPSPTPSRGGGSTLQEGMTIEHQRFGIGRVVKVEGSGENTKATINFRTTGMKQLLLRFAKYTIIEGDRD